MEKHTGEGVDDDDDKDKKSDGDDKKDKKPGSDDKKDKPDGDDTTPMFAGSHAFAFPFLIAKILIFL